MMRVLWVALMLVPASFCLGEETRTWEGTWNNRKYGTKGPLKCVASETESGEWKGKFTGLFQGDPFEYDATFKAEKGRSGRFQLSGKATIRGHRYQWTGLMRGKSLSGKYTSSVGYHGEFVLKEKRQPPKATP